LRSELWITNCHIKVVVTLDVRVQEPDGRTLDASVIGSLQSVIVFKLLRNVDTRNEDTIRGNFNIVFGLRISGNIRVLITRTTLHAVPVLQRKRVGEISGENVLIIIQIVVKPC